MTVNEIQEVHDHLIFSTEHSAWLDKNSQPTEKISEAHRMSKPDALQVNMLNSHFIAVPIAILREEVRQEMEKQEPVVV